MKVDTTAATSAQETEVPLALDTQAPPIEMKQETQISSMDMPAP